MPHHPLKRPSVTAALLLAAGCAREPIPSPPPEPGPLVAPRAAPEQAASRGAAQLRVTLMDAVTGRPIQVGHLAVNGANAFVGPSRRCQVPLGADATPDLTFTASGYLPFQVPGPLRNDSSLTARLVPRRLRIVLFGDSLTAGLNVAERDQYPARLASSLDQNLVGLQATLIGRGRIGDTYRHARERLERDVVRAAPDLVVVALGTNDAFGSKLADFAASIDGVLGPLDGLGCRVLVADIPYKPRWYGDWNAQAAPFNQAIAQAATQHHAVLVPWSTRFAQAAQAGRWDLFYHETEYDLSKPDSVWQGDIHPNAAGHQLMATALSEAILEIASPSLTIEASSNMTNEVGAS